jgi:hypothetical protein
MEDKRYKPAVRAKTARKPNVDAAKCPVTTLPKIPAAIEQLFVNASITPASFEAIS